MAVALGRIGWGLNRDKEGHRSYNIKWLVQAAATSEGPYSILNAAGLPTPGTPWAFGSDSDPWAFCSPECEVRPVIEKERSDLWQVEQNFTTKPMKRCQETPIENPLMEPPQIEGSFLKFIRAAIEDWTGTPIENSAKELITDPEIVDKDEGYPTVLITQNVLTLDLELTTSLMHKLNDAEMWGMPAKHIKLSDWRWQRLLYGVCDYFYRVSYEFEVNTEGFDRVMYDIGTQYLADGGNPDNQEHYVKYVDRNGELSKCYLDGNGALLPVGDPKVQITVPLYEPENLFLLGIPAVL